MKGLLIFLLFFISCVQDYEIVELKKAVNLQETRMDMLERYPCRLLPIAPYPPQDGTRVEI